MGIITIRQPPQCLRRDNMVLNTQKLRFQSGFTIIELLVGLVIGLLATLVVMQTFSAFEGNKRSTTGIADAQTNGALGLYLLQRELQPAGYGVPLVSGTMPTINAANAANTFVFVDYTGMTQTQINTAVAAQLAAYNTKIAADTATVTAGVNFSALNCGPSSPAINIDADGDASTPNATSVVRDIISPVIITDGGVGNSDTVTIHYGNTTRGGMPADVASTSGATTVGVTNTLGCRNGDVVLATRDGSPTCVVTTVTSSNALLDAANANSIEVAANTGIAQNDKLSCLGKVIQTKFNVLANQLQKNDQPVLGDIVSMQAQYGISNTTNSEIVTSYVDATGVWAPASITVANRNRVKAVRIAVVARNNLLEKDVVTQLCSGTATGPSKLCVFGGDLNLSTTDVGASWVNYRYRSYEVVVPLRNVLAASPQL